MRQDAIAEIRAILSSESKDENENPVRLFTLIHSARALVRILSELSSEDSKTLCDILDKDQFLQSLFPSKKELIGICSAEYHYPLLESAKIQLVCRAIGEEHIARLIGEADCVPCLSITGFNLTY